MLSMLACASAVPRSSRGPTPSRAGSAAGTPAPPADPAASSRLQCLEGMSPPHPAGYRAWRELARRISRLQCLEGTPFIGFDDTEQSLAGFINE